MDTTRNNLNSFWREYSKQRNAIAVDDIPSCSKYIEKHFENEPGEIWLFNSDLLAFSDKKTFVELYDYIANQPNIVKVKVILRHEMIYNVIDKWPTGKEKWNMMKEHLTKEIQIKDVNGNLQKYNFGSTLLKKMLFCYLEDIPIERYTCKPIERYTCSQNDPRSGLSTYKDFIHYIADEQFIFYSRLIQVGNKSETSDKEIVCINRRPVNLSPISSGEKDLRIIVTAKRDPSESQTSDLQNKILLDGFSNFMDEKYQNSFHQIFTFLNEKWKNPIKLIEDKIKIEKSHHKSHTLLVGDIDKLAAFSRELQKTNTNSNEPITIIFGNESKKLEVVRELSDKMGFVQYHSDGFHRFTSFLYKQVWEIEWVEELLKNGVINWSDAEKMLTKFDKEEDLRYKMLEDKYLPRKILWNTKDSFLKNLNLGDARTIEKKLNRWGLNNTDFHKKFESWIENFKDEEKPLALKVFFNIEFYSDQRFQDAVRSLKPEINNILRKNNFRFEDLYLILPETIIDSAIYHSYSINKLFEMNDDQCLRISQIGKVLGEKKPILFFNDTYGSGNQFIKTIWKPHLKGKIDSSSLVLVAAITISKKARENFEENFYDNVLTLSEYDAISIEDHQKFTKQERKMIEVIGKRANPAFPLGYGNCGLLIAYHFQCPNNTLSIIWADGRNNGQPDKAPPWNHLWRYRPKSRKK